MKITSRFAATALAAALSGAVAAPTAPAADRLGIGPPIELLPAPDAYQRTPAIAFGGGCFLVVWQDGWNGEGGDSNILGLRVGLDGKVMDGKPLRICTAPGTQEGPAVAWAGREFLVVWSDLRNGRDYDVYMARVTSGGEVSRTDVPVVTKEHNQACPRVACNGTSLVVWQDLRDGRSYRIFAARVGAAGDVLDPEGIELAKAPSNTPSVAASADGFLVVWTREGANKYMLTIGGARLGRDGKVLGEIPRHNFHGKPLWPAAASDGKDYLFICSRVPFPNYWGWGGGSGFYGARVMADGSTPELKTVRPYQWKLFPNVLDGSWLHKKDKLWPHKYSAVAWDGKEYVAVWTRGHIQNQVMLTNLDLHATRIRFPGWRKLDGPTGPTPDNALQMKDPPAPGIALADTPDSEAMPAIAAGARGVLLAAYEVHKPDGAIVLTAKVIAAP